MSHDHSAGGCWVTLLVGPAWGTIAHSTLANLLVAVQIWIWTTLIVQGAWSTGGTDATITLALLQAVRALICAHVAVIINAVAALLGSWVDVAVTLITVEAAVGACAFSIPVSVHVHTHPLAHGHAGLVATAAVIVSAITAHLGP